MRYPVPVPVFFTPAFSCNNLGEFPNTAMKQP